MKTAIVVGSTGLIGSHLLTQLLGDKRYSRVRILVRKPTGMQHAKLEEHVIDFGNLNDYSTMFTGEDLFCCLGTTLKTAGSAEARRKVDRDLVIAVAKAAEGKVKQFVVVSSVGADPKASNSYTRDKGEMEEAVAALKFDTVLIMQPSFFYGNRKEIRIGERVGLVFAKLLNPLLGKYKAIPADKIASAMITYSNASLKGVHRMGVKEIMEG